MQQPFDVILPKRRRRPWVAVAASVIVHSLLLFGWVSGRLPDLPRLPSQLIVLSPPGQGPEAPVMLYRIPQPVGEEAGNRLPTARPRTPGQRPARPELPATPDAVKVLPVQPEPQPHRADPEIESAAAGRAPIGRIGPGLAQGHLWVRPLPLPPKELAQRLSKSRAELVDSAVTAIVQAYLDSIASDPATEDVGMPSWTTNVAGKKFGLDSKNIYIAGLKIPAAVLALLPIPVGNIDQNRAYNHLLDLRADLQYAARRAETMEEFKTIIREIRLRKEREREFEKNQRTAPPPETPATP